MSTPSISSTPSNLNLPSLPLFEAIALETPVLPIPLERPKLTPPSELRFLQITGDTRDLGKKLLGALTDRLISIKESIEEITSQHLEKLKETAAKANSSQFWSILKKIATALVSAFSVVFGVSLLANGGAGVIGGAMIASGVLSLANFALTDLGIWEWLAEQIEKDNVEQQKKIATFLPAAVGIVCGGIGLLGSAWSVGSNAVKFTDQLVSVAQTALSLFDGITTLGKGCADASLLWTQADLTLIQGNLTMERSKYDLLIEGIKSCLTDFRSMSSKTKQTMRMITESNIQIVR